MNLARAAKSNKYILDYLFSKLQKVLIDNILMAFQGKIINTGEKESSHFV